MTEIESKVVLRRAEPGDGSLIAAIQLASWRATYGLLNPAMVESFDLARTAHNWAEAALEPTRRLRLAEYQATAIGYAFSGPAQDGASGELDAIYLLPTAHGLGAGRLLAQDALTGLAQAGFGECIAWVAQQNTHAHGFYEHLGFRLDGGRDVWRGLPVIRYRRGTGKPDAAERFLS